MSAFQLFTCLFPLEVNDAIIKETNRANDVRVATREKYDSMRKWEGLARQSFFRFLGLVLAMDLQSLPNSLLDKRYKGSLEMSLNRLKISPLKR